MSAIKFGITRTVFSALIAVSAMVASSAHAVDLTVSDIEIIQAVQFGNTTLVGENVTMVRVTIAIADSNGAVRNVDARLSMFVDGEEVEGSPFMSVNGPLEAPLRPSRSRLNDTINFIVLPPISDNVDFSVEVNPDRLINESNYRNNTSVDNDNVFACRRIIDFAYIGIDWAQGGGRPVERLIEPGIGDGFLRAIYTSGEWNYHESPLPPLVFNGTPGTGLLNTLRDIRTRQIPNAGYPAPEFVYGWLRGGVSGNGRAIGIPGDVAYGNTDQTRHQRTMAHEVGHLWGLSHHNRSINTIGIDTEHHLLDTQRLGQLFPSSKFDIMVAGQLTNTAFVESNSYNRALSDQRSQCRLPFGLPTPEPALRISGSINTITRNVTLDPVVMITPAIIDPSQTDGDVFIVGYNNLGDVLFSVGYITNSNPHTCDAVAPDASPVFHASSAIHVLVPASFDSMDVTRIDIVDQTGVVLAKRTTTPNSPQISFVGVQDHDVYEGHIRVEWTGHDDDGDALTYNLSYSPDQGLDWFPLVVNTTDTAFEFEAHDVIATRGSVGMFKLSATDGFNTSIIEHGPFQMIAANDPETYLVSPNNGSDHLEGAPIAFHAAVWDKEDQMLDGNSIQWTSDRDGNIGSSRIFVNSGLSVGTHNITLRATDSDRRSSEKEFTIDIVRRVLALSCQDVKKLKAKCKGSGLIKGKVVMKNSDFDGSRVTVRMDERDFDVDIKGKKAKFTTCCFNGTLDVELISPGGCLPAKEVTCP